MDYNCWYHMREKPQVSAIFNYIIKLLVFGDYAHGGLAQYAHHAQKFSPMPNAHWPKSLAQCPMPKSFAQKFSPICPMPKSYAQKFSPICPMPKSYAQCPKAMPKSLAQYAQCPKVMPKNRIGHNFWAKLF